MVANKFAIRYFDYYEVTVRFGVRGADEAVGKVLADCGSLAGTSGAGRALQLWNP